MDFYRKSFDAKLNRGKIFPVFIPFAGCPFQCIFCSQETQTGKGEQSVFTAIKKAEKDFPVFLEQVKASRKDETQEKAIDIAFYGGTFTAVPEQDFALCLDFFRFCKKLAEKHAVKVSGRCSTRPDALAPERLEQLKNAGIDLIELGIQSFDDTVLLKSKRGYCANQAAFACRQVLDLGFKLGIQLMAGLPAQDQNIFLNDVRKALDLTPRCLRYYPCLVPGGTGLAALFQKKEYVPWTNEMCIKTLGTALHEAWLAKIPVIRLTVAPEQAFDENLLAGPRHPALGSDILSFALYILIKKAVSDLKTSWLQNSKSPLPASAHAIHKILIPARYQGCFFGTKNRHKNIYAELLPLEKFVFDDTLQREIEIIRQ